MEGKQLSLFEEEKYEVPSSPSVPFVDEVEIFNLSLIHI